MVYLYNTTCTQLIKNIYILLTATDGSPYVEIVVYTKTFAYVAPSISMLDGYQTNSTRELLAHVLAHETVHVIQDMLLNNGMYQTFASKKGYHDGVFGNMVRAIFGHPMGATCSTWQSQHPAFADTKTVYEEAACALRFANNRA